MSSEAIVDGIRDRTEIESDQQARAALEATLQTLGERLSREEAKDLASFLPAELETTVLDWESASEGAFGVDEFLDRVAERSPAESRQQAQRYAQATIDALTVDVTERELRRADLQLPAEYDTLFAGAR